MASGGLFGHLADMLALPRDVIGVAPSSHHNTTVLPPHYRASESAIIWRIEAQHLDNKSGTEEGGSKGALFKLCIIFLPESGRCRRIRCEVCYLLKGRQCLQWR